MKNEMTRSKTTPVKGKLFSPYSMAAGGDLESVCRAYLTDPCKAVRHRGQTYFRIAARQRLQLNGRRRVLVNVDKRIGAKMGDRLQDEYGHEFVIECMQVLQFPGEEPLWHRCIPALVLEGEMENVGEYLTRM